MIDYKEKGYAHGPIEKHEDGWYFWDEIWSNLIGPYESEQEAERQLEKYCEELNMEK